MPGAHELGVVIQELTERAIEDQPSRNRPINLYVTIPETITLTESQASATLYTPPFKWYDGSTGSAPNLVWGASEWRG